MPAPSDVPANRPLTEPAASRLPVDHPQRAAILSAHGEALAADSAGYADPETGLFVLTAAYLAERGYCCEQGCRHCPYVDDDSA
ncbi:MAG TPA: DUF5522 domain-containing protein [Mycobacteriales bacterium]|nr:DUF5522 domain-containing protein [Mycobacteriales bacterium]